MQFFGIPRFSCSYIITLNPVAKLCFDHRRFHQIIPYFLFNINVLLNHIHVVTKMSFYKNQYLFVVNVLTILRLVISHKMLNVLSMSTIHVAYNQENLSNLESLSSRFNIKPVL
jgi:hypothetical protein